jgi:hypothetical protein
MTPSTRHHSHLNNDREATWALANQEIALGD